MKRDQLILLAAARARGWRVERTRRGHWRLRHPSGAVVVAGGTPSSPAAGAELRARLRRAERRVAP
jgi:hypothetical protein